jgi:hypothetical protein
VSERADPAAEGRGWARPGAGGREPGLSWEGESTGRRERPPGSPRSLAWRAVGVVALAALLGGIGLALARGTTGTDEAAGAVPGRQDTPEGSATPGDCLASLPGAGVRELDVVPCSEQHLGEVVGVVELPDRTGPAGYPGDAEFENASRQACVEAFTSWVGVEPGDSRLGLVALPPTEASWRAGTDRAAVCIAEAPGLVGSVRDTAR